ncbi:MAG TPA: hypothetical protein DIW47_14025 [Bacteroidetes bacterium]|nr:hypothetical protein [Bacteroidota bacterium]
MTNRLKNLSKLQRVFLYVAAFFLGAIILLLLFKGLLFQWVLNKQIAKINARSSYHISIQDSELKGISKAGMFGLLIQNQNGDSLVFIEDLHAGIRPFRLISGKHLIKSIELHQGFARYERRKSVSVPSDSTTKEEAAPDQEEELPYKIYRMFQRYFPSEMSITEFQLSYSDSLGPVHVLLDSIVSNKDALNATVVLSDKFNKQTWHFQGSMFDGINLLATADEKAPLPALYQRFGLDFRSDTIRFALENKGLGADGFGLHLSGSINGLELFHPKLSADTIGFHYLATEMDLSFSNSRLTVDTNSSFVINAIRGSFGLQVPLSRAGNQYALLIKTEDLPATEFFASLPKGVFDDTRGIEAKGSLAYTLRFVLDGDHPENVFFDSHFDKTNFAIKKYGATNLALMNGSFTHTVYENERPYRSFVVGPENPSFVPLEAVPQNLINAILVSEDPSFFHHRGFIPEAFRESIAENYRVKSFKRGGSTISMQLVKNVFLSRKKTVFRKIEEALIVWLIEGQGLTSKQRMMEVYVNIIEWGPGVYGIGEASQFYFSKRPEQLTLQECIYLANIIPRPKKFKYGFEADGHLRSYMVDLQHFILRRMVMKEMVLPDDTVNYNPDILLSGPARDLVVPLDTLGVDSLMMDEDELIDLIP